MQPDLTQMPWYARNRAIKRLSDLAAARDKQPQAAAQRHLDLIPPDPPELIAERIAVLARDYDHRGQRRD